MNRTLALLALPTIATLTAFATAPRTPQEAEPAQPEELGETMRAIVTESLVNGRAFQRLTSLCTTAPHRLSGSPGAAAAVEWARQQLEGLPFDEVRLEPVTVPHWIRGEVEQVSIVAPPRLAGEQFRCLALGGSVGTPIGGLTAEVLRVGSFDELRERGREAAGKIVFFDIPMDPAARDTFAAYGQAVTQRVRGGIEAGKAGAVGVVIRSVSSVIDDFPHTGTMHYQDGVPQLPAAALSTVGAERLTALLESGPVTLRLELDCESLDPEPSFNVVADYLGRENPEEVVLVSGHLDGWDVGQGAHDDGAGTCHAIEVVSLLAALDLRPRRTVRVVLYMNEENGLEGARAYAASHADELAEERGNELIQGGGGADISQLAPANVPLVGFRPDDERYFAIHHTHADTLEAVNQRELLSGAGNIAALVWAVAERSEPIPRNR